MERLNKYIQQELKLLGNVLDLADIADPLNQEAESEVRNQLIKALEVGLTAGALTILFANPPGAGEVLNAQLLNYRIALVSSGADWTVAQRAVVAWFSTNAVTVASYFTSRVVNHVSESDK